MEPVDTETVQDERMKATFLNKILVIAISAACLSRGMGEEAACQNLRDMGEQTKRVRMCLTKKAMEDWHCTMGDGNRVKVISITVGVDDYTGVSGRVKINPPVQEISSHVTACLSQGDEEDAACLNLRVMGEQSKMLRACLIQKAMGEQIYGVKEYYMGVERERGKKRHGSLYTYDTSSIDEKLQPTHHLGDQGGDLCHGAGDQHQGGGFGRAEDMAWGLSSCPEKQVHHRKSSMFNKGHRGNVIELTISVGKYSAMVEMQQLFDNVTKLFVMYGDRMECKALDMTAVRVEDMGLTKKAVKPQEAEVGHVQHREDA